MDSCADATLLPSQYYGEGVSVTGGFFIRVCVGGKKLERARDLYEQALPSAPPSEGKPLFEQYAKLEEEHGLSRHAMSIYERGCKKVPDAEKVTPGPPREEGYLRGGWSDSRKVVVAEHTARVCN